MSESDLRNRLSQVGVAVGRNRACVTGGEAVVVGWVAPRDGVGSFQKTRKLGAHHVVAELQLGRILAIPVGAGFGDGFERSDAFSRHRMGLHIRINVARIK